MPVEEGIETGLSAPSTPTVVETGPPPLPLPGSPGFMGPVIPGILPNAATGLRGRSRFEAEVNAQKFASGVWGHDFNQWVLSLKEDPSDPEYNMALQWAKANAQRHEQGTATAVGGPAEGDKIKKGAKKGQPSGFKLPEIIANPPMTASFPGATGPTQQSAGGPLPPPAAPTGEEEIRREKDWRTKVAVYEQPVFRGRPVGQGELYQPPGPEDATLQAFLSKNGIALPGDDRNEALRSGKYVYMGTEHNAELGATRDVYMYVEDASAAATQLDSGLISKYQSELGLQVTGRMDPFLVQYWDKAVEMASRYAMAGQKMSVREIFDIYVQSAIAQKKAGGSGGGGVGGGGADMEEWDYYRAMMQILGDISGVEG